MSPVIEQRTPTVKTLVPERIDQVSDRIKSLKLNERERNRDQERSSFGRFLFWIVLLGAFGAGGYYGYDYYRTWQATHLVPEFKAVQVAYAPKEEIILSLSGFVVPRTVTTVSPRVAGVIVEMPIEPGMQVKKGDLLAKLDDAQYRADYAQAKAGLAAAESKLRELKSGARDEEIAQIEFALAEAKAMLDLAGKERDRAGEGLKRRTVAASDYDLAVAKYAQAEAAVRSLEQKLQLANKGARPEAIAAAEAEVDRVRAMVDKAEYALEQTVLRAPIDGTILEKHVELGEVVRPEGLQTTGLCTMADLSQMEAEVEIQERDFSRVEIGQPCRVIPEAFRDRSYEGRLVRFQPQVNRAKGVIQARVAIENPDQYLLTEMNCRVELLREVDSAAQEALRIPVKAVQDDRGESFVYVVSDGKAQRRSIETGETIGDSIEVVRGLEPGDLVLLPGKEPLAEGQPVKTRI